MVILWSFGFGHWSFAHADSIFVGTLETPNVVIRELKGDRLVYEVGGRTNDRDAGAITRLVVINDPPINAAEEAFAAQKWDQAVDGYQRAMRTSAKPWVKDWAAFRLIQAGNKSNRFDAAAAAYIATLLKSPTGAGATKPAMPEARSTFLDTAATDVNAALNDPKATVEQKRALLGFLIEIQQARKDSAAEESAYTQLMRLPGADTNDPNARRVLVRRKLSSAQRALDAKNYPQAITEIESDRTLYNEPALQVDAFWILAEARLGLAGTDQNALKDAALAYMRVVTVSKDIPAKPRLADSLIKTAGILEQVNEKESARQLYQQVISQYPDDPSTARARDGIQRLRGP